MKAKTKPLKTKEQFLEFFQNIPDEKWTSVVLEADNGKHCALGHLGIICNGEDSDYIAKDAIVEKNVKGLAQIFGNLNSPPPLDLACRIIYRINDARVGDQSPKDNIISALGK